jgi:cell division protein FtsL
MLAAKKHDPSAVKVLDEQKENLKVLKKRSKKTTAAQNGRAFIACVTACALILCFSLVAVEAKLGKVGYEINEVKTQITELEAQCEVADLEIEQMKSLERIESYAKNNLGMVSIESSDIIYLNM